MATPKYTPDNLNLQSLLDCLNDIAAYPGTKDKEGLLKFYLGYTPFRQIVNAILNPYLTYGITDFISSPGRVEQPVFTMPDLQALLDTLAQRRVTGNAARVACANAVAQGVPYELMIRILEGDPKAGFGTTLVNKVYPGLLPEFPYMRCSLPESSNMDKWDWLKGILSQHKADGMFMNVNHEEGGVVMLMSRQGQIFPTKGFEKFHESVRNTLKPGTQTHGEMIVYIDGKLQDRQTGNGIINSVAQGGEWPANSTIRFWSWDQIPLSAVRAKGKYTVPYRERFKGLIEQCVGVEMVVVVPYRYVYSKKDAYLHFAEILAAGGEGTVVKNPDDLIWKDGTSKDQVKLKLAFIVDVKVTGFTKGNGKFAKTFGAVTYESLCGLVRGKVSGMDDKMRKHVSDNRETFLGTIMAVEANAVFHPSASNEFYSLSHPRVAEFRSMADKSVPDTLADILNQQQAAIDNAAAI